MRKLGFLVFVPLLCMLAVGCGSGADDLGLAPGESAVLLSFPEGGRRLVAVAVTRTNGGLDTGPQLTFGEVTDSGGECNTDDQGNEVCMCEWSESDIGEFGLCTFFAANNCETGTVEPTDNGYTCQGTED